MNRLEVEPLRRSLLLLVEDVLLGLLEVLVGDLHAALPQRHQTGLRTDGLGGREGEIERGRKTEGERGVERQRERER